METKSNLMQNIFNNFVSTAKFVYHSLPELWCSADSQTKYSDFEAFLIMNLGIVDVQLGLHFEVLGDEEPEVVFSLEETYTTALHKNP